MKRASCNQRRPLAEAAGDSAIVEHERARTKNSPGQLQGRLVQVSRLATIGEMAAGIANELNQPLTVIANYAEAYERLVGRMEADRQEVRSAFREIAAQALRAGDILRWLRDLADSQTVSRQPTDINTAIEGIRQLILAEARIHGARVEFELATPLPRVLIDTAQIQYVVLNLVRNGLQALTAESPSRRNLTVHTRVVDHGDVELGICDTGPGLTREALARLFEPFFSTKSSGTGLSLAISNTVVRAHGGTLTHRANVPHGARFEVRLPAVAERAVLLHDATGRRSSFKRE